MSFKFDLQRHSTPSPRNLLLGSGPLYFDRWDKSGNPTGLRHLGLVDKFPFKTDVQKISKNNSMSAARRKYAEAVKEIDATGSLTLSEFDPANLALGLFGEDGVINQTAQNVVDEVYTVRLGTSLKLPYYKVSDVVIRPATVVASAIGPANAFTVLVSTGTVTSGGSYTGTTADKYFIMITEPNTTNGAIAGCKFKWRKGLAGVYSEEIEATGSAQTLAEGVTATLAVTGTQKFVANDIYQIQVTPASGAYMAGSDYRTNSITLRSGMIDIPETSTIPDKSQVKISYSVPAGVFPKVSGATVSIIEGELLFLGDPSYGPCYNAEFWHVSITPNGDIGLLSDDFATFELNFTCLDDSINHPDDPMYRLVKLS